MSSDGWMQCKTFTFCKIEAHSLEDLFFKHRPISIQKNWLFAQLYFLIITSLRHASYFFHKVFLYYLELHVCCLFKFFSRSLFSIQQHYYQYSFWSILCLTIVGSFQRQIWPDSLSPFMLTKSLLLMEPQMNNALVKAPGAERTACFCRSLQSANGHSSAWERR